MTEPTVPTRLPEAVVRRPLIEVAPTRALLRVPGVGRVLVQRDGSVARAPAVGVEPADLTFLDDVVDALGLLLRGRFPLRAATVEVDGAAVVVCAPSPLGKSTIAMALAGRGYRFVGDSLATVWSEGGTAVVACPARGAILWPDAIAQLGLDPAGTTPVRPGLASRRWPDLPAFDPMAVRAVVVLRPNAEEDAPAVRGFDAVTTLIGAGWHGFAVAPLGLVAAQFEWAVTLATRVPVVTVRVPRWPRLPDALADAVLRAAGVGGIP